MFGSEKKKRNSGGVNSPDTTGLINMKRDYYEILGVKKDASLADIKKSYRSLALSNHPDRVPEEKKKESEEKFKEISEAYGVLSDSQKRAMYDQYGHAGIDQRYTSEDIFKGADFSSIFEDLAGFGSGGGVFDSIFGDMFGGGSSSRSSSRARRGRDIQYEIDLTLEEAFSGVKKKMKVPRNDYCKNCDGSGAKPGSKPKTCSTCRGQGHVIMSSGFFRMQQACSQCRGEGKIITEYCPECQGNGVVRVTRNIDVKIPAGVDNSSQMRIRGEGESGKSGNGDLYLYIHVKPHAKFKRNGVDIYIEQPVSFVKAALGGEISVATLNGNVTMKVPPGTQSGKTFRLKAKGMTNLHGGQPGDQYVKIMINVPTRLSTEQKKILEAYAQISGEDISAKYDDSFVEKLRKVFK